MPDQAPDRHAREFAAAFREFLDWIHSPAAGAGSDNEVSALALLIHAGLGWCGAPDVEKCS
jgi:hypothetical protein